MKEGEKYVLAMQKFISIIKILAKKINIVFPKAKIIIF